MYEGGVKRTRVVINRSFNEFIFIGKKFATLLGMLYGNKKSSFLRASCGTNKRRVGSWYGARLYVFDLLMITNFADRVEVV